MRNTPGKVASTPIRPLSSFLLLLTSTLLLVPGASAGIADAINPPGEIVEEIDPCEPRTVVSVQVDCSAIDTVVRIVGILDRAIDPPVALFEPEEVCVGSGSERVCIVYCAGTDSSGKLIAFPSQHVFVRTGYTVGSTNGYFGIGASECYNEPNHGNLGL